MSALKFIWCVLVYGTCAYAVFWLDRSGWWFLLAILIAGGIKLSCNSTERSKP